MNSPKTNRKTIESLRTTEAICKPNTSCIIGDEMITTFANFQTSVIWMENFLFTNTTINLRPYDLMIIVSTFAFLLNDWQ